jgi:hypothetical protein
VFFSESVRMRAMIAFQRMVAGVCEQMRVDCVSEDGSKKLPTTPQMKVRRFRLLHSPVGGFKAGHGRLDDLEHLQ